MRLATQSLMHFGRPAPVRGAPGSTLEAAERAAMQRTAAAKVPTSQDDLVTLQICAAYNLATQTSCFPNQMMCQMPF